MVELRDYQSAAADAVMDEWREGRGKTLLAMATGTGKTTVFGEVARRRLKDGVLVLAHRDELIRQGARRLSDMCGVRCEVEKANERWGGMSPLVMASVQTLSQRQRLDGFDPHAFGTVIVDEAHHSVSDTYRAILEHFGRSKVLGVTATPDRADRKGLASVYDSIAYEYGLAQAVKDGWLCPIRAKMVPLKMDIKSVKVSHGDYQATDLGHAIEPYLDAIAHMMARECAQRKTVCFLPLVDTAEKMADALMRAGVSAECVSGYDGDGERKDKIADFESGKTQVLCNSMLLTEGWDCPEVDCIVVLRPTRSRPLYAQMVGRGTRTAPGKDNLLLLDFLWMTERHDLCRPASLLGAADDVTAKMCAMVEGASDGIDLMDAEREAASDVLREREDALAAQLEAMKKKKSKLVDPLQFAASIADVNLINYMPTFAWERHQPTEKQLGTLERFNIDTQGVTTKGQASKLIDALMTRTDSGLATAKQIRFLEQKGYEHVGTWTKEQASAAIGRISSNGWRVPYDMRPGVLEKSDAFMRRAAV